jgi:hypothetical protein
MSFSLPTSDIFLITKIDPLSPPQTNNNETQKKYKKKKKKKREQINRTK